MSAKQPETIELDSDDEYSIEEVLDKKIQNGQVCTSFALLQFM